MNYSEGIKLDNTKLKKAQEFPVLIFQSITVASSQRSSPFFERCCPDNLISFTMLSC